MTNTRNINAGLGVPPNMALPVICRGSLTGWLQLVSSVERLSTATIKSSIIPGNIGGPAELLYALSIHPGILTEDDEPSTIYGKSVWITCRMSSASKNIATTLSGLPKIFTIAAGQSAADIGQLVRQVLAGDSGLIGSAQEISLAAKAIAHQLHVSGAAIEQHDQALEKCTQQLAEKVSAVANNAVDHPRQEHAATTFLASQIQSGLEPIKQASAALTHAGMINNLMQAMTAISSAWSTVEQRFNEVVTQTPLSSLGDLDYLENTLQLTQAAKEWNSLVLSLSSFIEQRLIPNT